jgi:hypothetical protein
MKRSRCARDVVRAAVPSLSPRCKWRGSGENNVGRMGAAHAVAWADRLARRMDRKARKKDPLLGATG